MKIIFLFILMTQSIVGICAEVDSHTGTDEYIFPATGFINTEINTRLKNAIVEINKQEISCQKGLADQEVIHDFIKDALIKDISSLYVGHFIAEYFNDMIPLLPFKRKIVVPFEQSYYKNIDFIDGFSLRWKGTLGIIKVNGYFHAFGANYIGMDKLGHFFVEGYSFYEKAYLEEDGSIDKAIEWGKGTEDGKYGKITTGVYSHADLIANFNGMRFWNEILHLKKDPLDRYDYNHSKPFFTCRNDKWKLAKSFDLDYFTDAAWDEKINCNKYRNDTIKDKIEKAFEHVFNAETWEGFCPAISSRCEDSKVKYKDFSKDLISPKCLEQAGE